MTSGDWLLVVGCPMSTAVMESLKSLQNGKEAIMKGCGCLLLALIGAVLLVKFSLSLIYYVVIAAVVLWLLSKVL